MRRLFVVLSLLTACFDDKADEPDGPGPASGDPPTAVLTAPTGDGPWYSDQPIALGGTVSDLSLIHI